MAKIIKKKGITIIDSIGEGVSGTQIISEENINKILTYINKKYS